MSILISNSKPIANLAKGDDGSVSVSDNQRIHLILDDSGSMRKFSGFKKSAIQQLKEGVISFLHIVRNAQVGIRWFNSPGVPISQVSIWHHDCINNGQAKGGNEHNQSLMDLEEGHYPNQASPGDIVIMFTDGKPNGKGLNVIKAAKLVKARGARIITIGCGDSEPEFMRKIATSHEDHHQVDDISQLTDIFANVGRSLAQRNVSNTGSSNVDAKAPAKQVQAREHVENDGSSRYGENSSLGEDEGFDYIENFNCHFCKNELRIICGNCATTHCGGSVQKIGRRKLGAKTQIVNQGQQITCPKCNYQSEIEMTGSVLGSASVGGMKK